ncbi:MAG: hypothetical protein IPI07_04095 [Flavobacteriales bacterium]|nr:hypothetical protein [Flavobacteriales bacterium]
MRTTLLFDCVRVQLAALIAICGFALPTYGTHVSGIDINWQCQGGNSYLITMNLFRDCSGISMSSTEDIQVTSDCGQSFVITLSQGPGSVWRSNNLCPPILPQSDCGNGGYPGMEAYNYQGIVTLNPPCDSWTISWSECCRNTSENVPNSLNDDMYAEAILNTATAPERLAGVHRPTYPLRLSVPARVLQLRRVRSGRRFAGVHLRGSTDGCHHGSDVRPALHPAPAHTRITLDQNTGAVTFTPTLIGNFIVVVQVEEFDATGQPHRHRDAGHAVHSQLHQHHPRRPAGYTNLSGDAQSTGPEQPGTLPGDQFCLELLFNDGNPTDSPDPHLQRGPRTSRSDHGANRCVNPAMATICLDRRARHQFAGEFHGVRGGQCLPGDGPSQATVFVTFPTTVIDLNDTTLCYATTWPCSPPGVTSSTGWC